MNDILQAVFSNAVLAASLALAVLAIIRVWRNPHLAHALWLLVLVKLLTPPLWHVPWPDGLAARPQEPANGVGLVQARRPAELDGAATRDAPDLPPPMPLTVDRPAAEGSVASSRADESAEFILSEQRDSPPPRHAEPALAPVPLLAASDWLLANGQWILLVIWGGGAAASVACVVRGQRRFRAVLAGSDAACDEWVQDAERFSQAIGLRRCPALRVTEAHVPPLVSVAGWTPVILLPRQLLAALDREQRHAVLVHELAHLRRRDHWVRWFEVAVLCLFWWNPVAWWAAGMLRAAAEECCDAWVLWVLPRGRRSYGRALLRTVEFLTERDVVPAAAGAAFGGFPVKRRIEMIMQRELPRKMSWPVGAFLLLLAAVVLPLAAPSAVAGNDAGGGDDPPASAASPPVDEPAVDEPASGPAAAQAPAPSSRGPADRKLEDRIERLERVVDDLVKVLKARDAQSGATPARKVAPGDPFSPVPRRSALNAFGFGAGSASVARPDHRLAKTFSDGKLIALIAPDDTGSEIVVFSNESGAIFWKSILPGRADGFVKTDDPAKRLAVRCGGKVYELDLATGKLLSQKTDSAGGAKPEPLVRIFRLKFAKASVMAEHIRKIYPVLTISADERANSVIAQGNERSLAKLEALVQALDTAEEK